MTETKGGGARPKPDSKAGDAVLDELRRMNRILATFTTRAMDKAEAIVFLDTVGFSSVQIGEILGVNPITARTTLHRSRKTSGTASKQTPIADAEEAPLDDSEV